MKASTIIQGAIDALNKYGWIQGAVGNPCKGFCMGGALMEASRAWDSADGLSVASREARNRAWDYLDEINGGSFPTFNDTYGRTKEEVIGMLRQAQKHFETLGD